MRFLIRWNFFGVWHFGVWDFQSRPVPETWPARCEFELLRSICDLSEKPRASVRPPALRRAFGDLECGGGLLEGESSEITQLHQFSLARLLRGKLCERLVHREELII